MSGETLIIWALIVPVIGAVVIALVGRFPNIRESVTLLTGGILLVIVYSLLPQVLAGARPATGTLELFQGVALGFAVEPLGMLFACVTSTLWIVTSVYSIGYMRGNDEPRQTPFYVCFAIAIAAAIGVAFAANLATLFLFYEILTISTYPLVTHKANREAMASGRMYLLMLLGTSMILLLPAIIWTGIVAGTLDFVPGGVLAGKVGPVALGILLAVYVFGIGKAALMPFHFWLPAAMVAPTPVSALLHAVAVVKAGVFTVLKVIVYVFGIDTLREAGTGDWLVWAASFTIIAASLIALTQDNLKRRLAYSTVSQLSYVVVGAALVTPAAVAGAGMHIAMHAAGKITLFFCAGSIYVAHHKTEISELDGIGRKMPITMIAFLLGALSIIGLPPLGGMWSKLTLGLGALDAGHGFVVGVLMLSSLLNVAYLLPIVARAFFLPPPGDNGSDTAESAGVARIEEAPTACLIALVATALLSILLFFQANRMEFLSDALFPS